MATLGQQAIGNIVKLNVNGTPWDFIVMNQGIPGYIYDSSADGTWLWMKNVYETRVYGTDNDYESRIHKYLNDTFVTLFDESVQNVIKEVRITYRPGAGYDNEVDLIYAKIFLLSITELNLHSYWNNSVITQYDGIPLSCTEAQSSLLYIATLNGSPAAYALRTPFCSDRYNKMYFFGISSTGESGLVDPTRPVGIRPALVLPSELDVSDDGSIVVPNGAITGSVNINGVQRELTGAGYINIDGVLRELTDSQTNIGGVLKSTKG